MDFHIVSDKNSWWALKLKGSTEPLFTTHRQADTIQYWKDNYNKLENILFIHRKDGTIRARINA